MQHGICILLDVVLDHKKADELGKIGLVARQEAVRRHQIAVQLQPPIMVVVLLHGRAMNLGTELECKTDANVDFS